jgi:hypothetical protein
MADPKDAPIVEVPPKTPWADRAEKIPKVGRVIAAFMRSARPWWRRRHEKKVQDHIDREWHGKVGKPERKDTP